MAQQLPPPIVQIEITSITEQELLKPGAIKLLLKRLHELENEKNGLVSHIDTERALRGALSQQLHHSESCRVIAETRMETLNHRNAVCQMIWGAFAVDIGLVLDFFRSKFWMNLGLAILVAGFLLTAVYLAGKAPSHQG